MCSAIVFGVTSGLVYLAAVAFLLTVPNLNLIVYCVLFVAATYLVMFFSVLLLLRLLAAVQ